MTFKALPDRARKDPFAFTTLNDLIRNQADNGVVALGEHNSSGRHNALEVPRAVATVVWDGSTSYSLEGETSYITAVSRVGAGITQLTLTGDQFELPLVVRITSMSDNGEAVPIICAYTVTSDTSITVYTWELDNLSGNTWALADGHYAIALHSIALAPGTLLTPITNAKRGDTLGEGASDRWNTLVDNSAKLNGHLLTEHTSAGVHNAREVAHGYATVEIASSTHALVDGLNVSSVANQSSGVCRINLAAGYTTPFQVFLQADYDRESGQAIDVTVAVAPRSSVTSSKVDVYLYQYNPTTDTWAKKDVGFSATIHHEPS